MMRKYQKYIIASVMAICLMIAYLTTYEYVIYFHEQHHLFRFFGPYLRETLHEHGLFYLLTEFIVQFSYWTWLGAIIWTALEVGAYFLTLNAWRRLTGLRDYICVSGIPSVMMFFSTVSVDIFPERAVKIFAYVLVGWIVSLILSRFVPVIRRRYQALNAAPEGKRPWIWLLISLAALGIYAYKGYQDSTAPKEVGLKNGRTRTFSREERIKQRHSERVMIEAERSLKQKDWGKLYEITQDYAAEGTRNHLMSYFRAMALYHQGKLLTNLMDYPQTFGVKTLFFPWESDRHCAEFGGYVYEDLGAVNAAQHWEFEALVGWGETATHLSNLARYCIVQGKEEQAKKFIAPLRHTLYYRGLARELDRQLASGEVDGLKNALADTPQDPARWDNVLNLGADLRYILLSDPQNKMAREYVAAYFLLANNLGAFYRNLKEFWPMPEEGYMPPLVEQGLVLVQSQIGEAQLQADGYRISPETEQRFREFVLELNKGQNARFTPAQRQTYWYYVQRVSPHGRELKF
ncbi:MAG: hypothetical protein HDR75_08645 [Bacteroides sp.]|nr:hypothetical protein [Bacteroides sp.]MBD5373390.1 hypothetical protein [Bacteroides sp.]